MVKIMIFAGSLRKDALSKKFARQAAEIVTAVGADVQYVELNDYPLPIYDEDLRTQHGLPVKGRELKKLCNDADAFIICTPEHNRSISSVLKNTLDWLSRKDGDLDPNNCFENRPILLLSSSPGAYGGAFAITHLRQILVNMKALVLGEQMPLSLAHEAFGENGKLKDEKKRQTLEGFVKKLIDVSKKLK